MVRLQDNLSGPSFDNYRCSSVYGGLELESRVQYKNQAALADPEQFS